MFAFVIAHHHPQGRIPEHLRALTHALPGEVVFVSTQLAADAASALPPRAQVIVRPNVGYDFYSYRMGIEALRHPLHDLEGLVLFNSSFVAVDPPRLLERCFARFGPETQLLGLTASDEVVPHLQSYWVAFGQQVLRDAAFREWWAAVEPVSDREQVIRRYELGMSRWFAARGFALEAAFHPTDAQMVRAAARAIDSDRLADPAGVSLCAALARALGPEGQLTVDLRRLVAMLNPTHFMWDALLQELAIVKLEFIRTNPYGLNLVRLPQLCTRAQLALLQDALA